MKMRIIALALLAVMLLGIFAGCTQTNPNPTTKPSGDKPATGNFTVPEGGYDGSAVTINFYHTMGANLREVLDAYILEFNKLYPNITIVHDQVGGYE